MYHSLEKMKTHVTHKQTPNYTWASIKLFHKKFSTEDSSFYHGELKTFIKAITLPKSNSVTKYHFNLPIKCLVNNSSKSSIIFNLTFKVYVWVYGHNTPVIKDIDSKNWSGKCIFSLRNGACKNVIHNLSYTYILA